MGKTFDQIVNDMFARLAAAGITDFNPGSVARTLVESFARGLEEAWYVLDRTPDRFFIDRAAGTYLDRRAWEWGVVRYPGAKARGKLIVSRSTPAPFSQLIPMGTQFARFDIMSDGSTKELLYVSVADAVLAQNTTSAEVLVEAAEVGRTYNLAPGTDLTQVGVAVNLIEKVAVSTEGLTGGADAETDAELRARVLSIIRAPRSGGTAADYVAWALSVTGVSSAKCIPLARGPGTVDVIITTGEGVPSQDLLQKVQNYIEERRPIGADVRVLGPRVVTVDVSVSVTVTRPGYDVGALVIPVSNAIHNYLRSVHVGGVVRLSGIGNAVYSVPGVEDYVISTPANNIQLAIDELARPGQITVG